MKTKSWLFGLLTGMFCLALSSGPATAGNAQARLGLGLGSFEPPVLEDINPAPDIVEVVLEARTAKVLFSAGKPSEVWTFNGSVPGPTIEAKEGDTLIVHFTNNLPEPTTIHWHGVETPANMDGSNISQLLVPGNGGYFRYEFKLLNAATHWYHPHVRTNVQVERGLAGALIIRDPAEDTALGLPPDDVVAVLDDVLLDETGQIAEELPLDPVARAKMLLDGREGNTLLVNGRQGRVVNVRSGEPLRLRLINVANARFMRLSVPGHTLYRIGGDAGLLEHPLALSPIPLIADPDDPNLFISDPDPDKGLLLSVAERADVIVTPTGAAGTVVPVEWHDFPRGRHFTFLRDDGTIGFTDEETDGKQAPIPLMYLRLIGEAAGAEAEFIPPANLRDIEPIDPAGAEPLKVIFGHAPPTPEGNVTFFAATHDGTLPPAGGLPRPFAAVTPAIAQDVLVGETRVWEITNLTGSDHPFHPHGWFFQPLEIQFYDMDNPANNFIVPYPYLENKDTLRIPKRPGALGRSRTVVRAAVFFGNEGREGQVAAAGKTATETDSGGWVFHCHINEHADNGMMSFIEVFEE